MISTENLKRTILCSEVVYQTINGIINLANDELRCLIASELTDNNWKELSINEAKDDGFEELANWSNYNDSLFAVELCKPLDDDYYVLVCVPKSVFKN